MPETDRMLALLNETFPDLTRLSPAEARAAADSRIRPAANLDDVASADDHLVDCDTHEVAVRVYRPHTLRAGAPVAVYAHGGGFLHGSIDGHDGFCRRWAKGTESVVVSVGYRLAPDAPPPAAREDLLSAVEWAQQRGLAEHGIILAGDSSGANLAAGAAIALRDRGDETVIGQVLLYPFLDPTMSTESHRTRGSGYFVTRSLLAYYWRALLGELPSRWDADVTPLGVDDLAGLPPALIITAGLDPLCDEGVLYAQRLRSAGTRVVRRHHPDQFHGFLTIPGYAPAASTSQMLWSDIRHIFTSAQERA